MASNHDIVSNVLAAQERIFRLALRHHGMTLKTISIDSGIPYNTLRSYASGHTMMPLCALNFLFDVIPDELLSHLTAPGGRCVVKPDDEGTDHDTVAEGCIDFLARKSKAHHPQSPMGVEIAPSEEAELRACRAKLRAMS